MGNTINYEQQGQVAIITLNRPDSLNSFNREMRMDLVEATQRARHDDAVRVVVITGAGRCFSAGADLKQGFRNGADVQKALTEEYKPSLMNLHEMQKPVIAAVNGFAAGIGLSFALVSDLVVMGEGAFLLSPFSTIGLIPDGGATWLLARGIGHRRAFQMAAEAERMPAATCLALGLANKVVPDDKVLAEALAWAEALARRAPLALARTKQALHHAALTDYGNAINEEAALQKLCMDSEDSREGIAAFLEKRKPEFHGK
jgi:2-(1,2-epoxy-1,2-dihydrophenyl)acetyl-CoA isomerase